MTSTSLTNTKLQEENTFETGQVMTIVGGHFIHDTYTAFVAPLLPLIIERLSLSLTMAGSLTAFIQLPSILNPFIGYVADKISLRYFVILAPAITATLIGLTGLAPSYYALAFLFLLTGISVAVFHAPAPAMIARVSGKRVGLGMSLFMAAGELGRTLGPIIAVSAVSVWGLNGIYRLIIIGWASSLILWWRFRQVSSKAHRRKPGSLRADFPKLIPFFLPLLFITVSRTFLTASITTYLPTLLSMEGASLAFAGISLSILEAAGFIGALLSGTISDTMGRKPTLLILMSTSAILLIIFLQVQGWLLIPILLLLGFTSISPQPVLLALVQDQFPENRATANGLYMAMSFLVRSLALVLLGMSGDAWGLRTTFFGSALIAFLAVPAILTLPNAVQEAEEAPQN